MIKIHHGVLQISRYGEMGRAGGRRMTDGRTYGKPENIMPLAPLLTRGKQIYMYAS